MLQEEIYGIRHPIEDRAAGGVGRRDGGNYSVRLFAPLPSPFTFQPPHPFLLPLQVANRHAQ